MHVNKRIVVGLSDCLCREECFVHIFWNYPSNFKNLPYEEVNNSFIFHILNFSFPYFNQSHFLIREFPFSEIICIVTKNVRMTWHTKFSIINVKIYFVCICGMTKMSVTVYYSFEIYIRTPKDCLMKLET